MKETWQCKNCKGYFEEKDMCILNKGTQKTTDNVFFLIYRMITSRYNFVCNKCLMKINKSHKI